MQQVSKFFLGTALVLLFLFLTSSASATITERKTIKLQANETTQAWKMKETHTEPFIVVEVYQKKKALKYAVISNCKRLYYNNKLAVRTNSCGKRWRLKIKYVSLNEKKENFRLKYEIHDIN